MISSLRQRRFFAEMSIHELGKRTGIDPAKISLIERGYKKARDEEKNRLETARKKKDESLPKRLLNF